MTLIRRRDPARNMADLLAGWSLVGEWGRIGRPGRVKELAIAETAAQRLEARKCRREYG